MTNVSETLIYTITNENGLCLLVNRWKHQTFVNKVESVSYKYQFVVRFIAHLPDKVKINDILVNEFTPFDLRELTTDEVNGLIKLTLKKALQRVSLMRGVFDDYRFTLYDWQRMESYQALSTKVN